MDHYNVQIIAKKTMEYIKTIIRPGMNLIDIRQMCEDKMMELGADSFWYWNIGAFIFSGDETALSMSGKRYQTSTKIIQNNDIITIDLSPQYQCVWGDYARTIIIENGKIIENIDDIQCEEWKMGLKMENLLHHELVNFVTQETTFHELYEHMNEFILKNGYINLDFLGNLGHSIEKRSEDRIYIEKDNNKRLSDVIYFTFEPHISLPDSFYGYKKENIYYFKENKLCCL